MFVDEAVIICTAGRGGDGCNSLDRSRPGHFRATGGDGGDGGSVILEASIHIQTLLDFQLKRRFSGGDGTNGSGNNKTGASGRDCLLQVPVGTEVIDRRAHELLKDLNFPGAKVVACKGGVGGKGNDKKNEALSGEPGEEKEILLKLKLIADIGIVGFPNSGKSTFISRVSNAKSKSASYPFTTKNPVLGVVKFDDGQARVLADIPGIIEGAHEGRGMGLEFLKHVERTEVLLHMIDFAGVDGRDPVDDYHAVNEELKRYSEPLAGKEQIVAANKMDVPEARENLKKFKKKVKVECFPISAITGEGVPALLNRFRRVKGQSCVTDS